MIKIAVCDDEFEVITQISKLASEYFSQKNIKYSVDCFNNGNDFLKSSLSVYDIIFLDIKINELNGLDIAEKVNLNNKKTIIILVSQFHEYMSQGYHVRAFRYILKPDLNSVFFDDMDSALNELNVKQEVFEYKIYSDIFKIDYDDILYFESKYPKVYIHSLGNLSENSFSGNIDEISSKLSSSQFIRIGKSYLVNARHIKKISRMKAFLVNGETLNVSRDYNEQAKTNLLKIKRGNQWNI